MKTNCVLSILLTVSVALAQTPAAKPEFEVASIKPAPPFDPMAMRSGKMHFGMKVDGARVDMGSFAIADLIATAYKVKPYQIANASSLSPDRYDILAKLPEGANTDQVPEMLQALLAERFNLTLHRDTQERPVYALLVGKGGSKLKESAPAAVAPAGDDQVHVATAGGVTNIKGPQGNMRVSFAGGIMHYEMPAMTPAALADMLSPFLDRPAVDMTGLKGKYDVALDLSMGDMASAGRRMGFGGPGAPGGGDAARPADSASDPGSSSIFESVQKLGLKLEARKAPVETLVIDHVDKAPTDN